MNDDDDTRRSDDAELPEAPLVRPYVESLGEFASPPATPISVAEAPTTLLPRITQSMRKHGTRGQAPLALDPGSAAGDPPTARSRRRLALVAAIVVAVLIGGYLAWRPGSGSSDLPTSPLAALTPSLSMPSPSVSPASSASTRTAAKSAAPSRTPSASPQSSESANPPPTKGAAGNLAAGRPVTDTGHKGEHVASNAVDGNPDTYWESANDDFPQSITVDLGHSVTVARLVLRLPPLSSWSKRTQALSIRGSRNSHDWHNLVGLAVLTFDPAKGNQASISFRGTAYRYVRLTFMANSVSPAGQASEIELFSS